MEERTHFEHRELSESEATLPPQGTGSSQQVPPLPAQGLCTVTDGPWSQRRRCTLFASPAFRHFSHSAGITTLEPWATATYKYYCPYMRTSLMISVMHST